MNLTHGYGNAVSSVPVMTGTAPLLQHVKELIAKQLNETDSNITVTRIGEQVDGGTFVDGTYWESIPLPVCPYINLVPMPPSTAARTKLCTVSL